MSSFVTLFKLRIYICFILNTNLFDLEKPGRRYKLEKAAEKVKEGTNLTDEELKEIGIENEIIFIND